MGIHSILDQTRVVMVETSHPGNLGAAARAMKTMGLSKLYLVNATSRKSPEAIARAAGAEDILENAVICEDVKSAVEDCVWVVGASARLRHHAWPLQTPREAIPELLSRQQAASAPVAMVFGNEQSGLSNPDLQACSAHVCIPTSEDFRSLNLAAAIQVLAYECRLAAMALGATPVEQEGKTYITREESERLLRHCIQVLRKIDFVRDTRPSQVVTRLRRLLTRAQVEPLEYNILRGILTAMERTVD